MFTNSLPVEFPSEASARPKYTPVNLTRAQTRKRNSFPGPDSNRFIDAMIIQQRESGKVKERL